MSPAPLRRYRRPALIAAIVLIALGLDAAAGFNFMTAAGCITLVLMQLLAMTAGSVLAVGGVVVWIFSGFKNQRALTLALAAVAFGLVSFLLSHAAAYVGFACLD